MDVKFQNFKSNPLVRRNMASPPRTSESKEVTTPTDSFTFSGATAKSSQPSTSTLKKVGIGLAAAGALGGAFLAGAYVMSQPPEEPAVESTFEDFGRSLDRDFNDLKTDWNRSIEDFKREFNRGMEDGGYRPDAQTQKQRDREDRRIQRQRDFEDAKKDIGREWSDFWRDLTD
ncbi:MAG TPA: hypothetical protein EYO33_12640 [Phycisphaerales bacterium]|nr:hypothetical protein [Phycisphaerales bacterium]